MKNSSKFYSLSLCLIGMFFMLSCSQTEVIVKNEKARESYSKVYYKNKIIYNTLVKKDKLLLDDAALALSNDNELSEPIEPLEQYYDKENTVDNKVVSVKDNSMFGFERLSKGSGFEFLSKKRGLSKDQEAISDKKYNLFGLLGFVFAISGLSLLVLSLFLITNVGYVFTFLLVTGSLLLLAATFFSFYGLMGKYKKLAQIALYIVVSIYVLIALLFIIMVMIGL